MLMYMDFPYNEMNVVKPCYLDRKSFDVYLAIV